MRRFMSLVLLVVLSAPGLAGAQTEATRTKRVAILDFDYSTVRSDTAELFGTDIDVGRGISDMLVTSLVNDGTYSVIERAMLDQILAEQDFSNSDRADSRSAAQIGRVLSVDAIIVGSVTQFGNDTRSTGLGGIGRAVGRIGFGAFDQEETKAVVAIDARIIDVDTAEILAVAQGSGESSRRSTSILGGGGSWRGFGAGGVNFGSSDFQETILGEAVRFATENLSGELVSQNARIELRQVVVEGLVAAVDGNLIIVNVGSDAGVRVGDRMTIERVTREIRDPATDAIIRRLSSEVGAIELIDVDSISAIGQIVAGADFQVGDVVKTAGG
ncbi:MAG: FlgO family outer membrane protein [Acidobacteria bacterium]|nr:FlgO family outer membrane protein [Acidobacteriota bacterium]